ncbi:MAG: DUF4989 domain-containing protein [Rikenellaceae bacterium]|nr:DUF4989 domain-containing protein [Rikenellaceae bacterium]
MKNIQNHSIFYSVALSVSILLGACMEDEKVHLAGYPDTPVLLYISGLENNAASAEFKATYDGNGDLVTTGDISRTYVVKLATPSPEDTHFVVEPVIENIPEDKVSISETKFTIPAGFTTREITVELTDPSVVETDPEEKTYQLGLRIVSMGGYKTAAFNSEAKVTLVKEAYIVNLSLSGDEGRSVNFTREYDGGIIVGTDPIEYTFRVYLDKPAESDVTVRFTTTGLSQQFAGDVTVTPAEVVIPAGDKVSEDITWTVTDDFLLAGSTAEDFILEITPSFTTDDHRVVVAEEGTIVINVSKFINLVDIISAVEAEWTMFDRSDWTADNSSSYSGSAILDGSLTTDIGGGRTLWATIDMKEKKDIAGIVTRSYNNSASYSPNVVGIYVSDDGETWKVLGIKEITTKTGSYYFKLKETVSAQYIMLDMTSTSTIYLAEVEVYGN